MSVKTSFSNLCSVLKTLLANKADKDSVYTKTDIDNKYFATALRGASLAEGTDLNDIKSPGIYYISSKAIAETCLNTPGQMFSNCRLEVFFSSGVPSGETYLMQKIYQNDIGVLYSWIRGMTTDGTWSPWHLLNGNDFTNYNYDDTDLTDKYVKLATYSIKRGTYRNYNMVFDVYSNYAFSGSHIYDNHGVLTCNLRVQSDPAAPTAIQSIWMSKGTSINTDDWFVTFNSSSLEFTLWKKITNRYESWTVQLASSSNRGISGTAQNCVTMYYFKSDADPYTSSDYSLTATSTTCNSTMATESEIEKITEKIADTGWITTENLTYRKSGCVVCLQGSVTPSSTSMSIALGTLPENCRPSQDISIAQAGTDTPSRQLIIKTDGSVTLLFASNCTASHTYTYNGTFMI